jgi:hypothetical protein
MSEVIRGRDRADVMPVPVTVPRRLPREMRERIVEEIVEGYVSAARVEAAAWVTSRATTQTAFLTNLEVRQTANDPVRAEMFNSYIEDFALVARQSIRRLGMRP